MFLPNDFVTAGGEPPVAAADLAAVVKLMNDLAKREPPQTTQHASVGADYFQTICRPGADVGAVWFRAALLNIALEHEPEFARFKTEGELAEPLLTLWSSFPFKPVDIQPDGTYHLNTSELQQELRKLTGE